MAVLSEESVKIKAKLPLGDVHKKMEVFYNPLMKSNRSISILLLNSLPLKKMHMALPLAGSGIRGLRFLRELNKGKIKKIFVNDLKENFVKNFRENLKLNKLSSRKVQIHHEDAVKFLLTQHQKDFCGYFDYIDLDPFGTPNPFLSAAVNRIKREGILAITATDTAALTGTYPKATKRKYWAASLRNHLMHETGLRILIRKVQLQGIQFDKALIPLLSYHKYHYFRVYFQAEKGKQKCDEIIKQHQYLLFCPQCLDFRKSNFNQEKCSCGKDFQFAGPLWSGKLFDHDLLKQMIKNNPFPEERKFLELLNQEKDLFCFYDLHVLAKKLKKNPPKMETALEKLNGSRTHLSVNGIKTEKEIKDVLRLF